MTISPFIVNKYIGEKTLKLYTYIFSHHVCFLLLAFIDELGVCHITFCVPSTCVSSNSNVNNAVLLLHLLNCLYHYRLIYFIQWVLIHYYTFLFWLNCPRPDHWLLCNLNMAPSFFKYFLTFWHRIFRLILYFFLPNSRICPFSQGVLPSFM